jgi:hypothetical protein
MQSHKVPEYRWMKGDPLLLFFISENKLPYLYPFPLNIYSKPYFLGGKKLQHTETLPGVALVTNMDFSQADRFIFITWIVCQSLSNPSK